MSIALTSVKSPSSSSPGSAIDTRRLAPEMVWSFAVWSRQDRLNGM
jgi:hypothetical protein